MTGVRLAIVGDCIASRPLVSVAERDAGFAAVAERLRSADAAIGNLETAICDLRDPGATPWGVPDDWAVRAEPSVAEDLRALGFDAFARANNHGMDWGVGGMRATTRLLDAAGLVHAGTGEDAASARAPRYVESPAGRVALVSATTSPSPADVAPALDAFHGAQPRPGVHTLGVRTTVSTDADRLAWLGDLRSRFPELSTAWTDAELELARTRFVEGEEDVIYEVDDADRRELLRSVRLASQHADAVVLALHVHQGDRPGELPPAFLRELGRTAIDAGAHVVAVSGPHRLGPVEIHAGRPILYGLGNFIWSDLHEPLPAYFWERTRGSMGETVPDPATATDADLLAMLNAEAFDDPEVFRAVIAEVVVGEGVDVRLHPVELGYGLPLTRRGIPRAATGDVASAIVDAIAERSVLLGTHLDVRDGIATIRS